MKKYIVLAIVAVAFISSCGSEGESDAPKVVLTPKQEIGERVFKHNCYSCHALDKDKLGPMLKGSLARWDNDKSRIKAFIKNSKKVIASGDPRAVKVAEEWNNVLMTPMPHLTNADLDALLEYMETASN